MSDIQRRRPRAIALCVFSNKERILVEEGYDPLKQQHFYRPIGGGIEYGEYSRDALIREIHEEINAEVQQVRYLGVLENIFSFAGEQGHEIAFIYDALFVDLAFYRRERFDGVEDDNTSITVVWKALSFFDEGNVPLYPDGLMELLNASGCGTPRQR